ncbi:MAG: EAL domain-containing protein [Paenibacillaceae bacterium]
MVRNFSPGTVNGIMVKLGSVLALIGLISFVILFFVVKAQIESNQKADVAAVTELITQAIEMSNESTETLERLMDLRLEAISRAIGTQLSGRAASTITRGELEELKKQWDLYDLSIFVRSGDDIVVEQSSDPYEVGISSKDWGYWYTAFDQLLNLQLVDVEEGFSTTNYWAGPLSKSEIYEGAFKYVYYYDGTTDFLINPFMAASELQDLIDASGPSKLIEKLISQSSDISEIALINIAPFLNNHNSVIIEPQKDISVLFGQHVSSLPEDERILRDALHSDVHTSIMFHKNGKKFQKIYISFPDDRILTIVMDLSDLNKFVTRLLLTMVLIYGVAFVVMYLAARKLNRRSMDMLNRINHLAYYDALTQLPNRNHCIAYLDETLSNKQAESKYAMLIIDLDNFKNVNDTLGHAAGDQLLINVTERLLIQLNREGFLARMGGDEFMVMLPISIHSDAEKLAEGLLACMREPFRIEGHDFQITMSIGISLFPQDGLDATTLLKCADMALYREKFKDKNNYSFFRPEIQTIALQNLELQDSIRKSLEQGHFVVYYQPQLDLQTDTVVGMEALIRWNHPTKGLLLPNEFIPIAEECGLIIPLGEWILYEALKQYKQLLENGMPPIHLSINLSARQFRQIDLLERINSIIEHTGMNPELLILEITESTSMMNIDYTIEVLTGLSRKGVRIAIDDFGTGYSSLSYLNRFPVQYLKIDCLFTLNIFKDKHAEVVVRSILDLANNLQLKVIAEGVETLKQIEYLKQYGCDLVQGYYICQPIKQEEILPFITKGSRGN